MRSSSPDVDDLVGSERSLSGDDVFDVIGGTATPTWMPEVSPRSDAVESEPDLPREDFGVPPAHASQSDPEQVQSEDSPVLACSQELPADPVDEVGAVEEAVGPPAGVPPLELCRVIMPAGADI
jgi:hypothetical protein